MHRLQYEMARGVYQRCLAAGITAPKYEHEIVAVSIECLDGGVGKLLPSATLVTGCLMRPYGQCGIEQQHTLLCPTGEVSGHRYRHSKVLFYLLKDILQRWGKRHSVAYRETQTVCLSWLMVWVLTYNDHLHLVKRTKFESIEDELSWGISCGSGIFITHKFDEIDEILFLKLIAYVLSPGLFYLYVHIACYWLWLAFAFNVFTHKNMLAVIHHV